MPIPAVLGAVIGSAASGISNLGSNLVQQNAAGRMKYDQLLSAARSVGATPTALVQGITGTAGGSVSSAPNSFPDVGSTINSAISSDAAQKESEAAKENAAAASVRAETERQLGLMRLKWDPQKYFADIQKSLSESFKNTQEAFLHGSMKQYYDELTTDIQKVRPWKLAGLAQGLLNDMATYDKIVQETRTSKAQEGYYNAAAYEATTHGDLNKANTDLSYTQSLTESLRGFRLQWENDLLSVGIDPNKPFWENTARLMYTNPNLFNKRMDMFVSALNSIDSRLQENLGEHYKRNAALGFAAYKFEDWKEKRRNARSWRNNNALRTISSFIPFLGGSSSSSSSMPWGSEFSGSSWNNRWQNNFFK